MAAFTKDTLLNAGGYIMYAPLGHMTPHTDRKFVARFKDGRSGAASFVTFLIKNFTVEEYFAQIDAGVPPLKILEIRGYLLPHIKKWLKAGGYSVDPNGYNQYITDICNNQRYKAA